MAAHGQLILLDYIVGSSVGSSNLIDEVVVASGQLQHRLIFIMPVNNNHTVVANASWEKYIVRKSHPKALSQQKTSNRVVMLEAGIKKYWIELQNVSLCTLFCIEFKETNLLKWIKRVPSMIRIYRHSELIGVTNNRGKRDREHIPEFGISSLF